MEQRKYPSQSRKFLITINNPLDKGLTHEVIINKAQSLKTFQYMCIADEVGAKEHTPHTHAFIMYNNPKHFDTMRNLFEGKANIAVCRGSAQQNRDYVFKIGKHEKTEKGTTALRHTQEEVGEMPPDRLCPRPELELLYELIKDGHSDFEIIETYPEYCFDITNIQKIRLMIRQEMYRHTFRNMDVTFIWGEPGTGKSRYVMDKYGYGNVFRVTDYNHSWDTYQGEEVVVFEEFASSLKIQDMLNYLDGYPLKLPARYSDKTACYLHVYIVSNLNPSKIYTNVREENRSVYNAFLRRINRYMHFYADNEYFFYESIEDATYPLCAEQCRALIASGITTLPAGERKPYVPYKTVPICEAQASDEEVQKLLRGFWDDGKNSK